MKIVDFMAYLRIESANRINQRVLGLTWRPRRMSFFIDHKPEEISKNDSNTNENPLKVMQILKI